MFSMNYNYQYIDWSHDPVPGEPFEHIGNLVSHIIRPTITIGLSDYLNISYQQTIGIRSMDWMGEGDSYHHRDENTLSDFLNQAIGNAFGDANINLKYLIVDCLRFSPHPSHYHLDEVLSFIKIIKPKKTILTNSFS